MLFTFPCSVVHAASVTGKHLSSHLVISCVGSPSSGLHTADVTQCY